MKIAVIVAIIGATSAVNLHKFIDIPVPEVDPRPVVTPGEAVMGPSHETNREVYEDLPLPGEGPDPAYHRVTLGPRYS